jgi:hypothetical protein
MIFPGCVACSRSETQDCLSRREGGASARASTFSTTLARVTSRRRMRRRNNSSTSATDRRGRLKSRRSIGPTSALSTEGNEGHQARQPWVVRPNALGVQFVPGSRKSPDIAKRRQKRQWQGNERQGNGTSAFQFFIPLPVIPLPYAVSGVGEDQRRSAVKEREGWATVLHSAFHGTPIPRLAEVPIRWGERPREP